MLKYLFILMIAFASCTSSEDFEKGKEQLEQMGYTDVEETGYAAWCCGEDDSYKTGFRAKNSKGNTVEGCFCSAWLKGVTVRFK